jgi:flagellar hook protein FlgE
VVYDSLGNALPLTITFTKVPSANEWDWAASLPASVGTTASIGTVTFDADGNLTNGADGSIDITGLTDGASDLTITWDLYDEAASAPKNDLTGYASPSVASSVYQDGFAPGSLQSVSVGADGMVTGLFTNGQTRDLAQLALADFTSPWGLARMGRTLFAESASSGQANVNTPGAGGVGFITGNSLEMSNVDLATEFVNMITYQRGYQASSRVVTITDDMLDDVMNLKR